jgi:hypothetical protein
MTRVGLQRYKKKILYVSRGICQYSRSTGYLVGKMRVALFRFVGLFVTSLLQECQQEIFKK